MQKFGIFSKIKTPVLIGRLIPAIMFATTIATPATAYKDYKCGCGPDSGLYDRPTCHTAPDYLSEYCVFDKTSSSFSYRMPDNVAGGMDACSVCWCYGTDGAWQNGNNGAIFRQVSSVTSTSALVCKATYSTEVACKSGYYDPREPDFMLYVCSKCPTMTDMDGKTLDGTTPYANKSPITACYIPKEDFIASEAKFQDTTGIYTITDDCYYSL